MKTKNLSNKLGQILFKKIFIWYVILTFLLGSFQIYNEYAEQKSHLIHSLKKASIVFTHPLMHSIWNNDKHQLKANIKAIMSTGHLTGISITNPQDNTIIETGTIDTTKYKLAIYPFNLISEESSSKVIATVNLYSTYDTINKKIKDSILFIIMQVLIKAFVLMVIFLYFTNKIITSPLNKLIQAMKNSSSKNYTSVDKDTEIISQNNELSILFKSYNDMQLRIKDEVDKNKAFEELFEQSSDGLLIIENEKFVQCNQAAIDMIGSKESIINKSPLSISPIKQPDGEDSAKKAKKIFEIGYKTGKYDFEWVNKRDSGEEFWISVTLTFIKLQDRDVMYVAWRDISQRKKAEEELERQKEVLYHQTHYDMLTELPNRVFFCNRVEQAISKAKRHNKELAILFIDLDRFKPINDSLGHDIGDKILIEVASRLLRTIRKEDAIARLGGDEFAILIEDLEKGEDVSLLAQKILNILAEPIHIDKHTLYISSSIGISLFPKDDADVYNLLKYADSAMYKAKNEGKNNFQFYSSDLTQSALQRVALETSLRQAIDNEEFIVYYQPQVDGSTSKIIGMEALVRWNNPNIGLIPPSDFIGLAEDTGLITQIDQWVMKTAMTQFTQWHKDGYLTGKLSLNLSMKQLHHKDFINILKNIIEQSGCDAHCIILEITESQLMHNPETATSILNSISKLGIELAIDDFGTGYSSLSYLKKLPINKLKIDQSFVKDLPNDDEDAGISKAVISLSKSLNLSVIAEGVETEEQKNFLINNGCKEIQGYFYSKPIPAEDIKEILLNGIDI